MTGRDLALASFWSERPLVALYRARSGQEEFSLKQLIAFAETLPNAMIEKMRGEPSQGSPHVTAPTRRPIQEAR